MANKPRANMPIAERAKQFMPFAALKGLPEALQRKEHHPAPPVEYSEDQAEALNRKLLALSPGMAVTITWYLHGSHQTQSGVITRIDTVSRCLHLSGHAIPFDALLEITSP